MTWLQEMAAENARLAKAKASPSVPSPVVSPVTSPPPSVTSPTVVSLATGVAARQARWRAAHPGEHRARHARYMRKLRARLASARNAPVTESDATAPATGADA